MIKEVAESTLKDVSAETSKLPDNVKLSSDVGESAKTGIESIGKRVDPETKKEIVILRCRNSELAGKRHPETDVPFVKRIIEYGNRLLEGVFPNFPSKFDAQLPEDALKASDQKQFQICNNQLKEAVEKNPELRAQFDEEQLDQIENGDTPDGYTWHHDAEVGKMQLVDTELHQKTGHTGGRAIWGGGTEYRRG